jgi:hypothetical protein
VVLTNWPVTPPSLITRPVLANPPGHSPVNTLRPLIPVQAKVVGADDKVARGSKELAPRCTCLDIKGSLILTCVLLLDGMGNILIITIFFYLIETHQYD